MERIKIYLFVLSFFSFALALACGEKNDGLCAGENIGKCPANSVCRSVQLSGAAKPRYTCVSVDARSDIGGICAGDPTRCLDGLFCYRPPDKQDEAYCSKICVDPTDCPIGYDCKSFGNAKSCVRKTNATPSQGCRCRKAGASCEENGHEDCALDEGYFCLSSQPKDPNAICVKSCDPKEASSCEEGFFCSQDASGRWLCVKEQYQRKEVGESCVQGGKAECQEELFCYTQYSEDPRAYCTKRCNPYDETSCPARFVCEAPRNNDPFLCIPRGDQDLGADCTSGGYLSCRSGFCAQRERGRSESICTQRCNPDNDNCPQGFSCRLFGHLYRYLCDRATAGAIGAFCNKNGDADCQSGICITPQEGAINRMCSQICDTLNPCPDGFRCNETRQFCIPDTGTGQIGDPCNGPADCVFGNCISNQEGTRFCSQSCQQSDQCPQGFVCEYNGQSRFCLPESARNGELGDPCPNGGRDCTNQLCINDPLKSRTFCSQPCSPDNPCPSPYRCHLLAGDSGVCTPQDYEAP